MMKQLLFLVFLFIFAVTWSQEKSESTKADLKATGMISVNRVY